MIVKKKKPVNRLVIDDVRTLNFEATHVRNIADAEYHLRSAEWDEVWLDHDMGTNSPYDDVSELVDWIEYCWYNDNWKPVMGKVLIHSANPYGAQYMATVLRNLGYTCVIVDAQNYFHIKEGDHGEV